MTKNTLILPIVTFVLCSCAVGPNYHSPKTNLRDYRWSNPSKDIKTDKIDCQWWKRFKDPLLSELIESVERKNLDVAIACQRMIQARSVQQADYARGGPKVSAVASVTNENISQNGRILGLFPNNPLFGDISLNRKVYQPGFDASWELDVFGQNFRRNQQRSAQSQAAAVTVNDTIRLIRAEIARAYILLRSTQKKITIIENNIRLQQKTLSLTKDRLSAGGSNELEVSQSTSLLKSSRAQLPRLRAELFRYASQISLLLGEAPNKLVNKLSFSYSMPTIPKNVAVGLPSDLLRRRPDIIAAERNIAAASAAIGVAVADLYPKFNLVADYSLESLYLNTLWRSNSSVWTLGPFMQWSLFQSGQIRANIRLKESQHQEAILQYQKTVLSALQEAENAIQEFYHAQQSFVDYQRAVSSNQLTVQLANQRYEGGEDDILSLIEAQRGLLQNENLQLDAESAALIQLVSVYKAVGGGWSDK